MAQKLPRLKANEVIKILQRNDFILVSQRGSHQKWRSTLTSKQVIVPYHKGKQLPLGTIKSIIEGSGISQREFLRTL
ncbi:MAG TPA: type II toxin-antitoxin system HicA family toxin [Dehalococcoidales bacterium]|nr:type II toxin-antitoxin system HicA family toxin [Dehalococcoidales bacterium]